MGVAKENKFGPGFLLARPQVRGEGEGGHVECTAFVATLQL